MVRRGGKDPSHHLKGREGQYGGHRISSPPTEFDEFMPEEAKKVVDSVKWEGS